MTWSIVARDAATGSLGVVVTTKNFAVGNRVPYARSGVGAVATQSYVSPSYGPRALDLLGSGTAPAEAVERVIAGDDGAAWRQLHLVDAGGAVAAHTGARCIDWCGHRAGHGFSVAGNMLAGPTVLDATSEAYAGGAGVPFAERLLRAMDAGQAAGGDRRGRQSAALLIHSTEDYADVDIRVDDHESPLEELQRLLAVYRTSFEPGMALMPTRANPAGIFDAEERAGVLARRRRELGLDP